MAQLRNHFYVTLFSVILVPLVEVATTILKRILALMLFWIIFSSYDPLPQKFKGQYVTSILPVHQQAKRPKKVINMTEKVIL